MSSETASQDESAGYTRRTETTSFIESSGGLLTEQLIRKVREKDCDEDAVDSASFALPNGDPFTESQLENEIGEAWEDLQERWDELTQENELFTMDVSAARERWILKVLEKLDFSPQYIQGHLNADGVKADLSHYGWPHPQNVSSYGEMGSRVPPIIHTIKPGTGGPEKPNFELDDGDHPGATGRKKSPHDELQTFLNANDEQQWGIVTDGLKLRILRDYYHTYTRGYIEFDLENIFTNRNYGDFRALYRLSHASRFIESVYSDEEGDEPPLEQLYQIALSTGVKVGQDLQENVVSALETLGNGFLNSEIEAALKEGGQDTAEDYYQDLLYIVYRLLFMLFAEQRGMMSQRDSLYTEEYSITKLRERAEQREEGDRNTDIWEGLKATFHLVGEGDNSLGVPGYNGALFDNDNLEFILEAECPNEKMLNAVHDLTHIEQGGYQQRISYADLGVEEIGAVYESLLEFTPQLSETALEINDRTIPSGSFYLDDRGTERKETGSFYTDPGLIDELIQSALKPVVENRVDDDASPESREQQLLDITVCDPAAGSGAFLIAANNFLGQKLAEIRSDSLYPDEGTVRQARRSVVQHCLYGVDKNPMAVELTKVSLWINSAVEDKPLSFLDHRIKQGNSLIGTNPNLISQGIPQNAYETSKGREWHVGNEIRKRVRSENKDDGLQAGISWSWDEEEYLPLAEKIDEVSEEDIDDVNKKEELYRELRQSNDFQREKVLHNVWTAAFFWPLDGSASEYPTPKTIEKLRRDLPIVPEGKPVENLTDMQELRLRGERLAEEHDFFHWPLEFPEVYSQNGFDCFLGNPPWDVLQMKDEEFFAVSAPEIAAASTQAKRKQMINQLEKDRPHLYEDYISEKNRVENTAKFIRESNRYPLTGSGEINIYAPFAEHALQLINGRGRSGIIVPTGIATESNNQEFFKEFINNRYLISLYGFVNTNHLFEGVDSRQRFCLLTLSRGSQRKNVFEISFQLTEVDHLYEEERRFRLTKDEITTINPNTHTCPVFQDRDSAELTLDIHKNSQVLIQEGEEETNPWGVNIWRMYDMATDSNLFNTKSTLESRDCQLDGLEFICKNGLFLPLYEAKLIHQYDHRFATFRDVGKSNIDNGNARKFKQKDDIKSVIHPRYWVPETEYEETSGSDWHLAMRRYARSDDERTIIAAILPRSAAGDSLNIIDGISAEDALLLLGFLNSFIVDYVARQKHGGAAVSQYLIKQLPIPSTHDINQLSIGNIGMLQHLKNQIGKLIYPAEDLNPFYTDLDDQYYVREYYGGQKRDEIRFELEASIAHVYQVSANDFDELFNSFEQIREEEVSEFGYFRTREEIKSHFADLAQEISFSSGGKS